MHGDGESVGNLNTDISEVIKGIRNLRRNTDDIELGYRKLAISLEELGRSWRDTEFKKVEGYVGQAGIILGKYKKDSEEYLDYVLIRLQGLMREYSSEGGSLEDMEKLYLDDPGGEQLDLEDLEGGEIELGDLNLNNKKRLV